MALEGSQLNYNHSRRPSKICGRGNKDVERRAQIQYLYLNAEKEGVAHKNGRPNQTKIARVIGLSPARIQQYVAEMGLKP